MKGKWMVQSNYIPGVGKMYRAIRLLDTNRIMESGNIEGFGEYSEDLDEVRATVNRLNAEEDAKNSSTDYLMRSCPVCGREFRPTPEWHWRHGEILFCRYHCYLKRDTVLAARNQKMRDYRSRGRIYRYDKEGSLLATYENVEDAAKDIGVPRSVIRAYCKKKAPDPTGARWELEVREEQNEKNSEENP